MEKRIRKIGDCYTKFNLKHTSKSQNTIPDDIRFRNYIVMTTKEKMNMPKNCSFEGGTLEHELVQIHYTQNKTLEEALKDETVQDRINNYSSVDEKDKIKFDHIVERLIPVAQNHVDNIGELPKQKWKAELEYTHWDDRIKTYFLSYVDLVGDTHFGDIKNVFGTLIKTKSGYSYTKKKCPVVPFHSDCLQIALYQKLLPKHKPFLTYASDSDRRIFTPENCIELRPESLEHYYDELVLYQQCWEKKLELADGNIEILAKLCKPDFSEIRKNGFWWKGTDPDVVKRFKGYYGF